MGFFGKLFRKKVKNSQQNFYTHIPIRSVKDLQNVEWGRALLKEIHDLKVEVLEYRQIDRQKEHDREQIKERKEFEAKINKNQEKERLQQKERSVNFVILSDEEMRDLVKRVPADTFPRHKTKFNKSMGRLLAIRMKSSDEGSNFLYPVILNNKKIQGLPTAAVRDFFSLFKNALRVPEEINSGLVESNIIFDAKKNIGIDSSNENDRYIEAAYKQEDPNMKVKVVRADQIALQEKEATILELRNENGSLYNELEEKEEEIRMYKDKIRNLDASNTLNNARGDAAQVQLAESEEKMKSMLFNSAIAAGAIGDLTFDKLTSERLGKKAFKKLKELQDDVVEGFSQSEREVILNELFSNMERFKALDKRVTSPPPPPAQADKKA